MNTTYRLERTPGLLFDAGGRRFDLQRRAWIDTATPATGERVDSIAAASWLQRHSGAPLRIPVGVIGPREASSAQLLML